MQRSAALTCNAAATKYDYDLVIIGCGVGGHGAAIHAVECVRVCGVSGCAKPIWVHHHMWCLSCGRAHTLTTTTTTGYEGGHH